MNNFCFRLVDTPFLFFFSCFFRSRRALWCCLCFERSLLIPSLLIPLRLSRLRILTRWPPRPRIKEQVTCLAFSLNSLANVLQLTREYQNIQNNPPPYIVAHPSESNILEYVAPYAPPRHLSDMINTAQMALRPDGTARHAL